MSTFKYNDNIFKPCKNQVKILDTHHQTYFFFWELTLYVRWAEKIGIILIVQLSIDILTGCVKFHCRRRFRKQVYKSICLIFKKGECCNKISILFDCSIPSLYCIQPGMINSVQFCIQKFSSIPLNY